MKTSSWQIKEKQKNPLWKVLGLRFKLQRKLSRVDKSVKKMGRRRRRRPSFTTIP